MCYILAIDQGSTSTKAMLVDSRMRVAASESQEIQTLNPRQGWVEHNPEELWTAAVACMRSVMKKKGISHQEIAGVGITNQRETFVLWERDTGKPIGNAISWQCKRGAEICERVRRIPGAEELIREKTGLFLDSYFTASKLLWTLETIPGLYEKCKEGKIAFGTIDSFLIYRLTKGEVHATDPSNASRTLLYNIADKCWDQELLDLWNIPKQILPEVKMSSGMFGETDPEWLGGKIIIAGCIGDAQGALFGQCAFEKGMAKNTYGTAANFDVNIGKEFLLSKHKLQTTIAWGIDGNYIYALEGGIYVAGAIVEWMRDKTGFVENGKEASDISETVPDTEGVYFVPAFVGLGAPHWDSYARGCIMGLSNATTQQHIVRAGMEAIVYQVHDVMKAAESDLGIPITSLRTDGGIGKSDFVMQFQADISDIEVVRPAISDTTALGAALLAGLAVGVWKDQHEIAGLWSAKHIFKSRLAKEDRERFVKGWKKAVKRSLSWANEEE